MKSDLYGGLQFQGESSTTGRFYTYIMVYIIYVYGMDSIYMCVCGNIVYIGRF